MSYPLYQKSPFEPHPQLRELRHSGPMARVTLWDGRQAWLITRYAEARRALADPRLSADATNPGFPTTNPGQIIPTDRSNGRYQAGLVRMPDARHRAIRRMIADTFTVQAAQRYRPLVQQIVDDQIATVLAGGPPADFVAGFAVPVPLRFVMGLLGVPEQDLPVAHASHRFQNSLDRQARDGLDEISVYMYELVARKEQQPSDDLVGQLIRKHLQTGQITRGELADLLAHLLSVGHLTTAATLGLSVLNLLQEPDRYRALGQEPDLIGPMVEEFLRFQSINVKGLIRMATADLTVGDTQVRAGEAVIISLASANRDEDVFDNPDELDIRRRPPRGHLSFGWGVHNCVGQHLARIELQIALTTLARTVPTLRLDAPVEQFVPQYPRSQHHGLQTLPVTW